MLKRKNKKYLKFAVLIVVLVFGVFLLFKLSNIVQVLFQVIFNNKIELIKSDNNVNILVLGKAGGEHEGPDLTDTIIFSSLDTEKQKVTMVSIPRDLWSYDLSGKVNTAYSVGEEARDGGGITLAKSVVSKIVGQKIDYAVVIDFSGFERTVDLLGGIDVDVDRSFDDYEYPITGKEDDLCGNKEEDIPRLATASSQLESFPCRYEHISFEAGPNHMNGETALKFVRSRHAQGAEGTDFARSQRQEKVITAIKDKALSLNIILNPTKVIGLYETVKDSIDTDIKTSEFDDFIKLAKNLRNAKIQSGVIDAGNGEEERRGFLMHPQITKEYKFQWVLIPRTGGNDFSEIHGFVECLIQLDSCPVGKNVID